MPGAGIVPYRSLGCSVGGRLPDTAITIVT